MRSQTSLWRDLKTFGLVLLVAAAGLAVAGVGVVPIVVYLVAGVVLRVLLSAAPLGPNEFPDESTLGRWRRQRRSTNTG
jgi:hypothetical protein